MSRPFLHEPDDYFVSLVDYLRHLVDVHDVEETPELWRSGRERFDELHDAAHGLRPFRDGERPIARRGSSQEADQ